MSMSMWGEYKKEYVLTDLIHGGPQLLGFSESGEEWTKLKRMRWHVIILRSECLLMPKLNYDEIY